MLNTANRRIVHWYFFFFLKSKKDVFKKLLYAKQHKAYRRLQKIKKREKQKQRKKTNYKEKEN